MAKINGIGGIFLNLEGDTDKLLKWYRDVLNVKVSEYGVNYIVGNQLTLLTFKRKSARSAIINFTVDNLEEMLDQLKSKGVKVVQEIEKYPYGDFAQIEDILGNVIELWKPNEKEYRAMIEEEIKDFSKIG